MTLRLALVTGDPAGISPELTARLLAEPETTRDVAVLAIGDRRVLAAGARAGGVALTLPSVREAAEARPEPGRPVLLDTANCDPAAIAAGVASAEGGRATLDNFTRALDLARAGAVEAVVFTPFNKQALRLGGSRHEDELRYACDHLGWSGPHAEFNVVDDIWNARVTSHVPLRAVADLITEAAILESLELTVAALIEAGVAEPRVAVAALNPHAGDGGNFGREEIEVIAPAVEKARSRGLPAEGPFPADTVYLRARAGRADAVLTMFHDQGQIAIKLLGFDRGVTVLGGLPVPITTPAHGTAYDIVGQGTANLEPTRRAFALARRMAETRRRKAAAAP